MALLAGFVGAVAAARTPLALDPGAPPPPQLPFNLPACTFTRAAAEPTTFIFNDRYCAAARAPLRPEGTPGVERISLRGRWGLL